MATKMKKTAAKEADAGWAFELSAIAAECRGLHEFAASIRKVAVWLAPEQTRKVRAILKAQRKQRK